MMDLGGLTEHTVHLGALEGSYSKENGGVLFGNGLNTRTKFF